jgi:SIT4-associating protein SAP185/190
MGYMGHLTLIAEEVVKFTDRHPPELLSENVLERVMSQEWINYVEGALAETRERDNAILGGVRPDVALGNRGMSGNGLASVGLSGLGSSLGLGGSSQGGGGSSALAEAGLNGGMDSGDNGGNGIGPFAISAGTLMSGFGSSSDEDDDETEETDEDVNNEVSYSQLRYNRFARPSRDAMRNSDHDDEIFEDDEEDDDVVMGEASAVEDGGVDEEMAGSGNGAHHGSRASTRR